MRYEAPGNTIYKLDDNRKVLNYWDFGAGGTAAAIVAELEGLRLALENEQERRKFEQDRADNAPCCQGCRVGEAQERLCPSYHDGLNVRSPLELAAGELAHALEVALPCLLDYAAPPTAVEVVRAALRKAGRA